MKAGAVSIALAAVLLGTGSASAQLRTGTWEINGFAGYLFAGNVGRVSTLDLPAYDISLEDDANYGGRLGYNLTSGFELEFEYSQTNTSFFVPVDPGTAHSLKIQYFLGCATFNFGHGRLVPFFTIGGGIADLSVHVAGTPAGRSDSRFTGSVGAGVKYFVTPHFALRADGRFLSTDLGSTTVFCGPYACTQHNWLNNGTATGGVVFAF